MKDGAVCVSVDATGGVELLAGMIVGIFCKGNFVEKFSYQLPNLPSTSDNEYM